jgi:hypothetical protein
MTFRTTVLSVVLATAAVVALGQPEHPTFLAVVDGNGLLTPIGAFDGESWWNRWPWEAESATIPKLPVPRTLAAIPSDWLPPGVKFPVDWRVLGPSGEIRVRALHVERPSQPSLMDTFVVRTTYTERKRVAAGRVAIAGPGALGRFVPVQPVEAQSVLQQLAPHLAALETAEIDRWRAERHETTPLTRIYRIENPDGSKNLVSERPPAFEEYTLLRAELVFNGRRYYSLDGEKRFTSVSLGGCEMNLSSEGVVITDTAGRVASERIAAAAYAEYCGDRSESSTPLATLELRGRLLWVLEVGVEDGYDYLLFDPNTGDSLQMKGTWAERR